MKKSVCIICLLCLVTISITALDLGDLEFEVISSRTENGQEVYEGIDQYGNELTIVGTENLTDASRKALQVMLSTFNGWKYLTIGTQRVVITEKRTEMALVPESFMYEGTDLAAYMPSGMQFYYTSYLEYDFRMYKEKLFLRLSGQLFDEEQFCEKLVKALENPILYIQTHNPDYIIEQLVSLASELEVAKNDLSVLREEHDELAGDYGNLKEEYGKLEGSHDKLYGDYELLRNAVMAFSNGNIFKLLAPLEQEAIEAVIEAKKADPEATSKDVVARLKEKDIAVSPKAVAIIFAVYFNDFEQ